MARSDSTRASRRSPACDTCGAAPGASAVLAPVPPAAIAAFYEGMSHVEAPELAADLRAALPTFFVIGASKCGTTSLHEYLAAHPEIAMTKNKEPLCFVYEWT